MRCDACEFRKNVVVTRFECVKLQKCDDACLVMYLVTAAIHINLTHGVRVPAMHKQGKLWQPACGRWVVVFIVLLALWTECVRCDVGSLWRASQSSGPPHMAEATLQVKDALPRDDPAPAHARWSDEDILGIGIEPVCNVRVLTTDEQRSMTADAWATLFADRQPVVYRHHDTWHSGQPLPAEISFAGWPGPLSKHSLLTKFADVPVHACRPTATPLTDCKMVKLGEWVASLQDQAATINATKWATDIRYMFNSGGTVEANFPELVGAADENTAADGRGCSPRDEVSPSAGIAAPALLDRVYPGRQCHASQVGVGAPGSGLPLHWHGEVHGNSVIAGRKRWFITPDIPAEGVNPLMSSLAWFRSQYTGPSPRSSAGAGAVDGQHMWECTLGPGDAMYIPSGFYHATLNIGETVAVTYHCTHGEPGSAAVDGHSLRRADVKLATPWLPTWHDQVRHTHAFTLTACVLVECASLYMLCRCGCDALW